MRKMNLSLLMALNFLTAHQGFGMDLDLPGGEPAAAVAPAPAPLHIPRKVLSPAQKEARKRAKFQAQKELDHQKLIHDMLTTYKAPGLPEDREDHYKVHFNTFESMIEPIRNKSKLTSIHQDYFKAMAFLLHNHSGDIDLKLFRQNIRSAIVLYPDLERSVRSSDNKQRRMERVWNYNLGRAISDYLMRVSKRVDFMPSLAEQKNLMNTAVCFFEKAYRNRGVSASKTPLLYAGELLASFFPSDLTEQEKGDQLALAKNFVERFTTVKENKAVLSPGSKAAVMLHPSGEDVPHARGDSLKEEARVLLDLIRKKLKEIKEEDRDDEEVGDAAPAGAGGPGGGGGSEAAGVGGGSGASASKKRGRTRVITSDDEGEGDPAGAGGPGGGGGLGAAADALKDQTPKRKPGGAAPGLMIDTDLGDPSFDVMASGGSGGGSSARKIHIKLADALEDRGWTEGKLRREAQEEGQAISKLASLLSVSYKTLNRFLNPAQTRASRVAASVGKGITAFSEEERRIHIEALVKLRNEGARIAPYCKEHGLALNNWNSHLTSHIERSQGRISMVDFKGDREALFKEIQKKTKSFMAIAKEHDIQNESLKSAYRHWKKSQGGGSSAALAHVSSDEEGSAESDSN